MNEEIIKNSLLSLEFGKVATFAMTERGPYAEVEVESDESSNDNIDATTSASQVKSNIFTEVAQDLKTDDEDIIIVRRKSEDLAMTQEDFDWFIEQMKAKKHLIFIECLMLGTSEIKGFINSLLEHDLVQNSKLVLLDLATIEYMTLRDFYKDKLEFV